jgi:hypothetical protein
MTSKLKCNLIQNKQLLIDNIPNSLKNLSYGIYPDSTSYNDNRFIYNKLFNYFPLAMYYPRNYKDISYLIKEFVANDSEFTIRCGGHSNEPTSLSNGFIIDVKNINSIKINKTNKTVKIGSGTRLGPLVDMLKKYKLTTALGDSSCIGMSGLSLSGGKGFLSRLHGMVCDNIISLQVINYEGELISINENNYPDLLWAYKGAGICNFGVVHEIEIKLYDDVYCRLDTMTWEWDSKNVKKILKLYQKWVSSDISKNITTDFNLMYNNGSATFAIKCYRYGTDESVIVENDFMKLVCLKEFGYPETTTCEGYFSQVTECWMSYDTGESHPFSKIKSSMIFNPCYNDDYLESYTNSINRLLESNMNVYFQYNFAHMGGKVLEGNSCYFSKEAIIVLTMFCSWGRPELTNCCKSFINHQSNEITKYTSKYVFPNMIDYDLEDYMTAYYGNNKCKLMAIKKKYDPNNIFKWKHSIKK